MSKNNTITDPLFLTINACVSQADYRKFRGDWPTHEVVEAFEARLGEVYGDKGEVLTSLVIDSMLASEHHERHDVWEVAEELEYDPMNALGVAGFVYRYDVDEESMVFSRGEGENERHMLGHPIRGGVNLMLGGSFYNETLIEDHETAESFVEAFTAKWEELVSDHYDEDEEATTPAPNKEWAQLAKSENAQRLAKKARKAVKRAQKALIAYYGGDFGLEDYVDSCYEGEAVRILNKMIQNLRELENTLCYVTERAPYVKKDA